jgi:hypothetical protein
MVAPRLQCDLVTGCKWLLFGGKPMNGEKTHSTQTGNDGPKAKADISGAGQPEGGGDTFVVVFFLSCFLIFALFCLVSSIAKLWG